ncbi:unnamed protein product [Rhizoctonia solani]|uniref:Ricin B lectin domain-containing protein n=3 Tax=Rhizoctonia solani TaxID=456999 RepID=A0A8H3C5Z6_9AGAM|nr:ricin-type beta-trefoil lectin domain protein [Rhizoctonia solani AG-3 Rhs1AP]KEP50823.1 ricin-type beta-trefoil lectin domain protein [Rhizoctonia solani 123E]CAE6470155.1 unnamed protein product [Rhizoctonia solani]CAE6474724.1 unnamed protein product [Rhizoctonia solani]
MANIEPGTYRIVNLARNKVLRVPNEYPDTIASWHVQDEPNQKWLIERNDGGYRFKNCGHGQYLSVRSTQSNSQAYHGSPTTWKIIPQTSGGYLIQLETIDRVLDLHDRGEVYIWPANDAEPQKVWKFEKLGREAGEKVGADLGTDKSPSKDAGEKAPPPLSPLAARDVQITQQAQKIQALEKQLSGKDKEIDGLRRELEVLKSQESSQVTVLSGKIAELEELVERLLEQESKKPNNAP